MDLDPPVIAIEGLIGSGKTSFITYLKTKLDNVLFIEEPVPEFQSYKSYNPLAELNEHPFAAQYHIIQCLKKHYKQTISGKNCKKYRAIITERDLVSPLIFTDAMHRNGSISHFERDLLGDVFQDMKSSFNFPNTAGIFYLSAPPETCLQRVKNRNRKGEEDFVSLQYLTNLKAAYESYFNSVEKSLWIARHDTDEPEALLHELEQLLKNV